MHSTEKPEFAAQVRLLFAGFNVPASDDRVEAYWLALKGWHLAAFVRVVEHALGEQGPDKLPTVAQMRGIAADLRSRRPTVAHVESPREFLPLHGFGQRCLFRWLKDHAPVDAEGLARLVAEKNRLIGQYETIATEEKLEPQEVREALFRGFARVSA